MILYEKYLVSKINFCVAQKKFKKLKLNFRQRKNQGNCYEMLII
jgi:hypothetical protein